MANDFEDDAEEILRASTNVVCQICVGVMRKSNNQLNRIEGRVNYMERILIGKEGDNGLRQDVSDLKSMVAHVRFVGACLVCLLLVTDVLSRFGLI